jgi:hypothetical protein
MRCCACNKVLSDVELILKTPSKEFADMCGKCYSATYKEDYDVMIPNEDRDIEDLLNTLSVFEEHRYE